MSNAETDWVPDTSTFGARLALVRWKMGWNIREAERECNLTQNTWSGWEHGKTPRNIVEVVTSVHWATSVNRDWLLFGTGNPGTPSDAPGPKKLPHLDSNQEPAGYEQETQGELISADFTRKRRA